jgi:hypothetical protein
MQTRESDIRERRDDASPGERDSARPMPLPEKVDLQLEVYKLDVQFRRRVLDLRQDSACGPVHQYRTGSTILREGFRKMLTVPVDLLQSGQ